MLKCEICGKAIKNKSGMTAHLKKCMDETVVLEDIRAIIPDADKRLAKIKDAYKSSHDAEHRYRLECEYKSLGGIIEDLRKK